MSVFTFPSPFVRLPLPPSSPSSSYSPISLLPPSLLPPDTCGHALPASLTCSGGRGRAGQRAGARHNHLGSLHHPTTALHGTQATGKEGWFTVHAYTTHTAQTHVHSHSTHCEIFTSPHTPSHPHTPSPSWSRTILWGVPGHSSTPATSTGSV